jgi:hypothetical protein
MDLSPKVRRFGPYIPAVSQPAFRDAEKLFLEGHGFSRAANAIRATRL